MAKIVKFEDIIAWQKAGILAFEIYIKFNNYKDYGFRNQIQRASVSVMNNIAEGFERRGDKEFKRFLLIAKGSCGEVRSMSYLALKLKYFTDEEFRFYYSLTTEISRMLNGLIRKL